MKSRLEILNKVAAGELSPEDADKQLSDINQILPKHSDIVADTILTICLVPHGYQMDLISHEAYLDNKVDVKYSECRDYGGNVNVKEFSYKIIDFVRNGER